MITLEQLVKASGSTALVARAWLDPIKAAMALHDISTPRRIAAFLSQIGHESHGFRRVAENLNYTPAALLSTFNTPKIKRFTPELAEKYGRTAAHPANQQMIANIAYANRMGNGPVESGDGWFFRGRGPGQLTGRNNITRCGRAIGFDLAVNPGLLERPDVGALAFAWFWTEGNATGKSLNVYADAGNIDAISDLVNIGQRTERVGDAFGYAERVALNNQGLGALA